MTNRHRAGALLRATVAVLGLAALMIGTPITIIGLYRATIPVTTPVAWFHYHGAADAPPLDAQLRTWIHDTYQALRLDLGASGLVLLAFLVFFTATWLILLASIVLTLAEIAHRGAEALRQRAATWGPRGWIASLLTTLVLSGTASPAHAITAPTRAAAAAPHHPHPTSKTGREPTGDQPVTPGDHAQPPPRAPSVHLPADIRPDCPRYRVHRGDTLSTIAQRELGTLARLPDLARLNAFHLANPDHLEPGWQILLPPEAAPPKQGPTKVVTVVEGDTLWSLSERELGTPNRWGDLWNLNLHRTQPDGLQLSLPDKLQRGWQIVVPDEPHNRPAPGYTPTAPAPSPDPFNSAPWPDPFPSSDPSAPAKSRPSPVPGVGHAGAASQPDLHHAPPESAPPQPSETSPSHPPRPRVGAAVEPAPGVFLGLGLAAAISIALARTRLRQRSKDAPAPPRQDHLGPTVHALRLGHVAGTHDPETHEPRTTEHTHPAEADRTALRPRPPSAPKASPSTPLPVELGVQVERTVRIDLAACQGLGLSGPVQTEAVRALLLGLLARHTPREDTPTPVVITRADAELLLAEPTDPPRTVRIVDDLPDALDLLEAHDAGEQASGTPGADANHTVLIARTPVEHAHRLHSLLHQGRGLAAVLLGPWTSGVTLTLDGHGVITQSSTSSEQLRGTRVFTATAEAGQELLPLTPTPRTPLPPTPPPANLFTLTYGHDPRPNTVQHETARPPHPHDDGSEIAQHPPETGHGSSSEVTAPAAHAVPSEVVNTGTAATPAPPSTDTTNTDEGDAAAGKHGRDPAVPPFRLHVFGRFHLMWTDTAGTEHELRLTHGQRVLVTYLAIHPHGVARETLLDHLWGEVSQPTNTCNTQLSRLRSTLHQATGGEISRIIDTTHHHFRLDPTLVTSDYAEFDHAAARLRHAATRDQRQESLQTLLRCHTGALAPDLADHEWIQIPRQETDRIYVNAIGELARIHVDHDPDHTLHLLESALRDDPHNEALYRDIMRLQRQLDLTQAISRTYTLLQTRLAELDLTPDESTTALAEQLPHHTPRATSP